MKAFSVSMKRHRLLLLKVDKQSSGAIYWPFLAVNETLGLEGEGALHKPRSLRELARNWHHHFVCLVLSIKVYGRGSIIQIITLAVSKGLPNVREQFFNHC